MNFRKQPLVGSLGVTQPKKRSRRVLLLGICISALLCCSYAAPPRQDSWFGGYAQVTSKPLAEISVSTHGQTRTVLAFVVSKSSDPCSPTWIDDRGLDEATRDLNLEQQIEDLRQQGGEVGISFGGAVGDELATACNKTDQIVNAYRDVINRYQVDMLDFDIEMNDLKDSSASRRRAQAVAQLQQERPSNDPLEVWLTLPVSSSGLDADARKAVETMLDANVALRGVNLMTMNFDTDEVDPMGVLKASKDAASAAHGQLMEIYSADEQALSSEEVWNRMGLTPMIGQNDMLGDVFSLPAAAELNKYAREHGIGRVSFWSLNRDRPCGPEWPDARKASYVCSGVNQNEGDFARTLGEGLGR